MHRALDEGITFFDNAWDYHDGRSEELMGRALAMDGRRDKVFLMTKNCERDHAGSLRNLEDSLQRLRTDHIDLWQFHEIIYDNDPDWVFEKGGMAAALEARKAGKVRFIGFTGHKHPAIHRRDARQAFRLGRLPDAHQRHGRVSIGLREGGRPGVPAEERGGDQDEGPGRGPAPPIVAKERESEAVEAYRYALSQPIAAGVVGLSTPEDLAPERRPLRGGS